MMNEEKVAISDEYIAKKVQAGDVDAFGELMHRYEAKLKRYGHKFLSGTEEIDDLVQDVFIKTYENIQSFDANLRFSPWVYRIAHNVFVNELKRKKKYGFSVFDPDVILPLIPSTETADQDTLNKEQKVAIESQLETLSAKYREVVVLHYMEELSYQEISEVLKISVTAVGARMTRAREKLRVALSEHNR